MEKVSVILSLLLLSLTIKAQLIFKTTVQQQTVEVGKSFFVQYVLENFEETDDFTRPIFNNLRLVSGPAIYYGSVSRPDGVKPVKNFVFTLVAPKPGRFIIPGAAVKVNGNFIKSNEAVIEAIEKTERIENASEYFLQPGEDPYEKMRKNLFMKVMVNKRSCYVGEPVVATFKLYSRLQSKSDIVKNPGFYGFSVRDIISLDDRVSSMERENGKTFDVHTIRTVQLYPLQAGMFMIDAMEVLNKAEFSKSVVNKKTEQEINEGVHENTNESTDNDNNTVTYENSIRSEKITIQVKPHPVKNKPVGFTGATGRFSIRAELEKKELAKNEEGDLMIRIEGKGNFIQLSAPAIQWPGGIEGFDAVIKDSLDKTYIPLKGNRAFRFPFVAAKAGTYIIPAVSLSFFDTDSNNYKTVSTSPVEIKISASKSSIPAIKQKINSRENNSVAAWWWWAGGGVLIGLLATTWWLSKKRKVMIQTPVSETDKIFLNKYDILQPAYEAMEKNDSRFYTILQKSIWDHLGITLNLYGSKVNKYDLRKALLVKGLAEDQSQKILDILQECEAAAYTKAEFLHDKQELFRQAKMALEQIKV